MSLRGFAQCQTENSYLREVELAFADCDRDGNVRPSALLSLTAAMAGYDYDARGLTHQRLWDMGEVFLLSRVALKLHRRPVNRERLSIETWEDGARGAHMRRAYELADEAGRVCVSARSEWILVDPAERRILRPDSFTAKRFTVCPTEIDCPECRRVALPRGAGETLMSRPVRWSDLDGNGHVYSGNYGDIVWDALPPDLQSAPLSALYINYCREATLGEVIDLRGLREDRTYTMEGWLGEERCFSCRCEFI